MKDIKLMDERGMYLFTNIFRAQGKDIMLMETKRKSSFAGTPAQMVISILEPTVHATNPAFPLEDDEIYDIVIIKRKK